MKNNTFLGKQQVDQNKKWKQFENTNLENLEVNILFVQKKSTENYVFLNSPTLNDMIKNITPYKYNRNTKQRTSNIFSFYSSPLSKPSWYVNFVVGSM